MVEKFMQNDRLILSTLSPIHIGCGVDYEPTHYLMDEGVLYTFDPVAAFMADLSARQALLDIVDNNQGEGVIQKIQQFFYQRKERLLPHSLRRMPVGDGVQAFYDKRVGHTMQADTKGVNRLNIERISFVALEDQPILPGSSLKGAMRTALLDAVHNGKPLASKRDAEGRADWKKLDPLPTTLGDSLPSQFFRDPMRLIRLGDASPTNNAESCNEVVFAVNRKSSGAEGRGPYQVLECLAPMSLESFSADLSILDTQQARQQEASLPPIHRQWDNEAVTQRCNRFYQNHLLRELQELSGFLNADWMNTLQKSLDGGNLGQLLAGGQAFLLRVGRHSGAESVTLNGARHIKIIQGKGNPPAWGARATTFWMAARGIKQEHDLLPFGWLLVELDHDQRRPLSESVPELAELARHFKTDRAGRLQASDAKVVALRRKETDRQQQEAQRQAEQARLAAEQAAEQARMAALSPNQQQIEAFRQAILDAPIPQPISGALWGKAQSLVKLAIQSAWSQEERQALVEICRQQLPAKLKGVDTKKQKALIEALLA